MSLKGISKVYDRHLNLSPTCSIMHCQVSDVDVCGSVAVPSCAKLLGCVKQATMQIAWVVMCGLEGWLQGARLALTFIVSMQGQAHTK